MSSLSTWLRRELDARNLSQTQAAVHAGVAQATLSAILNDGHVPRVDLLFRLADYFAVSREQVLRLAGHLPTAESDDGGDIDAVDEHHVRALLAEFRRVPDEWKPIVVQQVAQYRRLAELRPQVIGDDAETEPEEQERTQDAQAA